MGFSSGDVEKGKASYDESAPDACELEIITVTEAMLDEQVGDVLDRLIPEDGHKRAKPAQSGEVPAGVYKYKVVLVNTVERQQVLQVMRCFKAALPDSRNMIFAVITDTARTWTFADYIGHLMQEHEQMMKR